MDNDSQHGERLPALADILECTDQFEKDVLPIVHRVTLDDTTRAKLTMVYTGLDHEHWMARRTLMASGLFYPAIAFLRLQFEATVQAFWVDHAAPDS